MLLFESLPFELTFRILFEHGGFDSLEMVLGRNVCWELLKIMNNSPCAELLCICRTIQLLAHPAHALFLLNYPPDSSIPENRRAWDIASECCTVWEPNVRAIVLAMRAFLPSARQHVFPWLDIAFLEAPRSETEWKRVGLQMGVCYKFDLYWWNSQREAFHLEKAAVRSDMRLMIFSTAEAEKARLFNRIKRGELVEIMRMKERVAWKKSKKEEQERRLKENNSGTARQQGVVNSNDEKLPLRKPSIFPEDRKKAIENAKLKEKTLHSILDIVKRACSIPTNFSPTRLEKIATLIVSIETEHPFIKWNLRLIFHGAATKFRTATAWDVEFLLYSLKWEVVEEGAVEKLKKMK
jgi:hypothetical protein